MLMSRVLPTSIARLLRTAVLSIARLAITVPSIAVLLAGSIAAAASSTPAGPLVVDRSSHIVVMEYEAWFGPKAVTFQSSSAMPLLQSPDMQAEIGRASCRERV